MTIETPCVKVCAVDRTRGLCVGCGRSLDEIAAWADLGPEERRRIMGELTGRLAGLPADAGPGRHPQRQRDPIAPAPKRAGPGTVSRPGPKRSAGL